MELQNPTVVEPHVSPDNASSPSNRSRLREAASDIAVGSVAGAAGKLIEFPFDTIKVRLQSTQGAHFIGPVDCFKQSIAKHGVYQALYRGVSAPTIGAAIETSSLFLSYNLAQQALKLSLYNDSRSLPLEALCLSGAASGAFTSLVLTPIELVKCRIQVNTEKQGVARPGVVAVIGSVLRDEGLLGFWRGQLGTLIRETGGSAAWFGSYEGVSALFKSRAAKAAGRDSQEANATIPVWQQLVAGAVAGMIYNFSGYPADTLKTRMQTEVVSSGGVPQSFWSVGKTIWREQGLRGLYRGCGITVARSAPSSAVIFTIYESLKGWIS